MRGIPQVDSHARMCIVSEQNPQPVLAEQPYTA